MVVPLAIHKIDKIRTNVTTIFVRSMFRTTMFGVGWIYCRLLVSTRIAVSMDVCEIRREEKKSAHENVFFGVIQRSTLCCATFKWNTISWSKRWTKQRTKKKKTNMEKEKNVYDERKVCINCVSQCVFGWQIIAMESEWMKRECFDSEQQAHVANHLKKKMCGIFIEHDEVKLYVNYCPFKWDLFQWMCIIINNWLVFGLSDITLLIHEF